MVKALLKEYAKQHFELFLRNKTDENDLDRAHLLMKRHRRQAHGLKHPGSAAEFNPFSKPFKPREAQNPVPCIVSIYTDIYYIYRSMI